MCRASGCMTTRPSLTHAPQGTCIPYFVVDPHFLQSGSYRCSDPLLPRGVVRLLSAHFRMSRCSSSAYLICAMRLYPFSPSCQESHAVLRQGCQTLIRLSGFGLAGWVSTDTSSCWRRSRTSMTGVKCEQPPRPPLNG